eukprot:TRINITY_DN1479_c2_g1_i1.p1 TRINITY_DN1479_c2_g1~~TRINITY_DN1479_c2_g1_i1.p1  ORF type:complete len:131 (-),score=35.04 TRINITY_DN1479_c2_g1_i1:74-466(-)
MVLLVYVSLKDARSKLYELLAANLIILQEIPKSSDHSATRCIYVWGAQTEGVINRICLELMFTIGNLKSRLTSEQAENNILLERIELDSQQSIFLTDKEKQQLDHWFQIQEHLQSAILYLANELLTLYFF